MRRDLREYNLEQEGRTRHTPGPSWTSNPALLPIVCKTCLPFAREVTGSSYRPNQPTWEQTRHYAELRGHTVLLMIKTGFCSVMFHGPSNRSGGVTGQNSHPLSGSCVMMPRSKRVTFTITCNCVSMKSSGVGPTNGRTSLQVTAERSRSTSSGSLTSLRTADPSPAIA